MTKSPLHAVSWHQWRPIDIASLAALALYAFMMSITPGPNNVMLTTSGLIFGLARGRAERYPACQAITVLQAGAYQFVNPKAWLTAVTVIAAFVCPVFALVGIPCMTFRAGLRWLLGDPAKLRLVNRGMAVLAAITAGLFWMYGVQAVTSRPYRPARARGGYEAPAPKRRRGLW